MAAPAQETREHLLAVAERLFAEHGLDAVSMRQINREAGQRNTSSIHYYFGNREAVIEAVVERRMSGINQRRLKVLGELEAAGKDRDLREVVAAYIRPLAAQVHSKGADNAYVRFLAQAYASTQIDIGRLAKGRWDQSINKVVALLRDLLPELPEAIFQQRMSRLFRGVVYALADRERDVVSGSIRADHLSFDDFVEDLIETNTAALRAPHRVA